ncbi:MAG: haloacid dehalogenase type II [Firmicutes bacterium]|nr:haloacid dehalogenase type II [Bacillota bacterium]MCL5065092.1 haloacid dehalogenase type II [Bacillota bacterium]
MVIIQAIMFDAYGTLFDVQGMMQPVFRQAFGTDAEGIQALWRSKYHEYNLIRAVTNHYVDYWQETINALVYAARHYGYELSVEDRIAILEHYHRVGPFAHVQRELALLSPYKKALVSNGTAHMLATMLQNAAMTDTFDVVVSSEDAGTFKPNGRMYALGLERLNVPTDQAVFVSSNSWDVLGAQWFGLRSIWLKRAGMWEELGDAPNYVITSLVELLPLLAALI